MEIDYLEPNKKFEKRKKIFMVYMVVVQFIFTVFGLAVVGYYIGSRMDPEGGLDMILAAVGTAVGVLVAFMFLYQYVKSEERRNERRRRH